MATITLSRRSADDPGEITPAMCASHGGELTVGTTVIRSSGSAGTVRAFIRTFIGYVGIMTTASLRLRGREPATDTWRRAASSDDLATLLPGDGKVACIVEATVPGTGGNTVTVHAEEVRS